MILCIPELMNISFQQWPSLADNFHLTYKVIGGGKGRVDHLESHVFIYLRVLRTLHHSFQQGSYLLGWLPPLDICLLGVTGKGQVTKSITNRERGIAAADYNPIPRTKTSGRKKSCLLANLGGEERRGCESASSFWLCSFYSKSCEVKKGKVKGHFK